MFNVLRHLFFFSFKSSFLEYLFTKWNNDILFKISEHDLSSKLFQCIQSKEKKNKKKIFIQFLEEVKFIYFSTDEVIRFIFIFCKFVLVNTFNFCLLHAKENE